MERIQLFDGIALNIIVSDKFKTNFFDFNVITPLRAKTAPLSALLPAVLKRGTKKYPGISALNKKLDDLYSASVSTKVIKRGEAHIFGFTCEFLKNSLIPEQTDVLMETLSVLEEILYRPLTQGDAFRSDYTESEKANLIDAIGAQMNNKNAYAIQRCVQIMCEGEDYGTTELGDIDGVKSITPESLFSHYETVFCQSQIEMFFIGECDISSLTNRLKEMFAGKRRGAPVLPGTQVITTVGKLRDVTEEMPVNQGKLSLGFRTGFTLKDKDYAHFALFNELFGGSPTSKLFEHVRERLSLCYYCRSIPEAHKGVLIVASGIEVKNRKIAQREILKQLDAVRNGDFTERELELAKRSAANGYRELYDDARALSSWHLSRVIAADYSRPEDAVSAMMSATAREVRASCQSMLLDTVYFLKGTLDGKGENV